MTSGSRSHWRRAGSEWMLAVAVAGLAVAVLLPGLGSAGLWEPDERAVALAALARHLPVAPGDGFRNLLPALGLSWLGGSETAARLPGALAALVTVGLVHAAGRTLLGRRAGLYGACILVTLPAFVLGARHLTSETPLLAAFALALAGLGGFVVTEGGRRWLLLVLGVLGLVLGSLAGGLLVGAVGPALAVSLAFHLTRRTEGTRAGWAPRPVSLVVGVLGIAALLTLALSLILPHAAGQPSWRLGGRPTLTGAATFEGVLRAFGFATFPWGALACFALLRPLVDDGEPTGAAERARRRFADCFLLLAAALGLALATLRLQLTGELTVAFLPAAALALGGFLEDQGQRRDTPGNALLAVLLAGGAMVVARDLGQAPVELVAFFLASKPTWPVTLEVRGPFLAVGAATALASLALVARPGAGWPASQRNVRLRAVLAWIRRAAPGLLLATGALLALGMSHRLLPELSRHLSPRSLFATFERLRAIDGSQAATLAIYAESTREAPWASAAARIATPEALAETLGGAPGPHLAERRRGKEGSSDRQLADRNISYAVADASSSRLLLLASRLPPGETDHNPLHLLRWRPSGNRPRPWAPPQRPVRATFGEAIELSGADFPAKVHRPGGLPLTLHLRALRTPPPDHQIFVHLERPGTLLNGDHHPLGGIFPTTLWAAGDELRDSHQVPLPLVVAPAGTYRVLVGFWPGGNTPVRLPVTAGGHDGRDRVFLGTVQVQ